MARTKKNVRFTDLEYRLVALLLTKGIRITKLVKRRSAHAGDLDIEYVHEEPHTLAGLRGKGMFHLICIRELINWTDHKVAAMSGYPPMVRSGDWSGIRDSTTEQIRWIFTSHVMPLACQTPPMLEQARRLKETTKNILDEMALQRHVDHPEEENPRDAAKTVLLEDIMAMVESL